jgi:hypothetical protein
MEIVYVGLDLGSSAFQQVAIKTDGSASLAIQALSLGCEQTTWVTSGAIIAAAQGANSPASRCT